MDGQVARSANAKVPEANERLWLATENAEVGLWDVSHDGNIGFFHARSAFKAHRGPNKIAARKRHVARQTLT
jgi:hypothetical protein